MKGGNDSFKIKKNYINEEKNSFLFKTKQYKKIMINEYTNAYDDDVNNVLM